MVGTSDPKRSRLAETSALRDPQVPLVVLDLASVETYLLCQPLTGLVLEAAGAIWCPLASDPAPLDRDRGAAGRAAAGLQLPLAWPVRHPAPVPQAMRVAALACGRGLGASTIYGLSRLAFGGGGDLDDSEEYLLALEETGLTAHEARLAAADGSAWDTELRSLAAELRGLGISGAPALRWGGHLYLGGRAIAPVLAESQSSQPPLDLA